MKVMTWREVGERGGREITSDSGSGGAIGFKKKKGEWKKRKRKKKKGRKEGKKGKSETRGLPGNLSKARDPPTLLSHVVPSSP